MKMRWRNPVRVLVWGLTLGFAACAQAQELAQVISSTPVVQLMPDQQSKITHYNVVYEYAGKQYSVQMPSDPGSTVAIQVTPVAVPATLMPPAPATSWPLGAPAPVAASPIVAPMVTPIYVTPYPYAYGPAYYGPPPFTFSVGVGYHRGWGRHWR